MDLASPKRRDLWAPADAQEALDLFNNEKLSYAQLAAKYGKSRGSIAGLINRFRQKSLVTRRGLQFVTIKEPSESKSAATRAIVTKAPVKEHRIRLRLVNTETEVTFAELNSFHCRYPLGDPKFPDFRFCGKLKCDAVPYCKEHCTMCYAGLPQRRK